MSPKKQKNGPLILLAFLMLSYVGGIKLIEILNLKRKNFKQYTEIFEQELESSISNLNKQVQNLKEELELKKNHSILETNQSRRIFQSYLKLGELDSIRLYSNECKNKQSYTLYDGTIASCPKGKSALFEWEILNNQPAILISRTITINGQTYYLQGQLHINETWLKKKNKLFEELQSRELKIVTAAIGTENDSTVLYTSKHKGTGYKPAISTEDSLSGLLSHFWTRDSNLSSEDLNLLFFAILLLFIYTLIKSNLNNNRNNKLYREFNSWVNDAKNISSKDLYKKCLNEKRSSSEQRKNLFIQELANLLLKNLDKSVKVQSQYSQTLQKLKDSEQREHELKRNQQRLEENNSLVEEVSLASPEILAKLKTTLNNLDECRDILQNSTQKSCELVLSHLREWQSQGEEIGYRKYLRSLSETKGNNEDVSILEEQVTFFKESLSLIDGQVKFCQKNIISTYKQNLSVLTILNNWADFLCEPNEEKNINLLESIEEAKELLSYDSHQQDLFIQTNIDPNMSIVSKEPKAKLVSSLRHLFSFCLQKKLIKQIYITSKKEGTFQQLLITCTGQNKNNMDKNKTDYFKLSKNLVSAFNFSQESIHLDEENLLICLGWNEKELKQMISKDKLSHGALSLDH